EWLAGCRIVVRWSGRPHAAADHIRTNNEEPIRVDRLAGTDHQVPPASLACHRMATCGELIARQGVANHHRVGLRAVELTVCLIGDGEGPECAAGIEPKWLLFAECDCATRIGAGCRE